MKLYLIPVEKACDAKCRWCITNFRKSYGNFLDPENLKQLPEDFQKIEITGGGEPTLHRRIDEIISICARKAKTQMYTHGAHLSKLKNIELLDTLCVSIAHYNPKRNRQLMSVCPDLKTISSLETKIKFSLLIHKSGISEKKEFLKYLSWAEQYANKVVVRQIFNHNYQSLLFNEFISSEEIFRSLDVKDFSLTHKGNLKFSLSGLEVELECRSCACEKNNPVLHANGVFYRGWSDERL